MNFLCLGFKNGCKVAVVSPHGEVLDTGVFYLHNHKSHGLLKKLVDEHRVDTIAIGNGTACRETEKTRLDLHFPK